MCVGFFFKFLCLFLPKILILFQIFDCYVSDIHIEQSETCSGASISKQTSLHRQILNLFYAEFYDVPVMKVGQKNCYTIFICSFAYVYHWDR